MRQARNNQPIGDRSYGGVLGRINETADTWRFEVDDGGALHTIIVDKSTQPHIYVSHRGIHIWEGTQHA